MEEDEDGDGFWRTVGGRKVFIKKGQKLSEAMKESGKFPDKATNFLKSKNAIRLVKRIAKKENRLNCCENASKKIVKELDKLGYKAKVTKVKVFNKTNAGSDHVVVEYKDKLYDYTGEQYTKTTNSPADVRLKIYHKIKDNIYSENEKLSIKSELEVYNYIESDNYTGEIIILK